jgi:hypothetical protein
MIGIIMGAALAVLMTRIFLEAYPGLKINLFQHPEEAEGAAKGWQSAMTYKFVGVLGTLDKDNSKIYGVMGLGIVIGIIIQSIRKALGKSAVYQAWRVAKPTNKIVDFVLDALLIASPYASSFGGFVGFTTSLWFGLGGIFASMFNWFVDREKKRISGSPGEGKALPEDMSSTSLVGGGLIAGESLFALFLGLSGLIAGGALAKIFGGG